MARLLGDLAAMAAGRPLVQVRAMQSLVRCLHRATGFVRHGSMHMHASRGRRAGGYRLGFVNLSGPARHESSCWLDVPAR
jgi:hypothetical protein